MIFSVDKCKWRTSSARRPGEFQAMWMPGVVLEWFGDFKRLSVSGDGPVTCQTVQPALAQCPIGFLASKRAAVYFIVGTDSVIEPSISKKHRGGVVEDDRDIQDQQIRHAAVTRLLDRLLVRLDKIHGPEEVLELQRVRALDTDILCEPPFVAAGLEDGGGAIRHQRKQRPLDIEVELARGETFPDHRPVHPLASARSSFALGMRPLVAARSIGRSDQARKNGVPGMLLSRFAQVLVSKNARIMAVIGTTTPVILYRCFFGQNHCGCRVMP